MHSIKPVALRLFLLLAVSLPISLFGSVQESLDDMQVPSNFRLDFETAARLRTQFRAQSVLLGRRYATALPVLKHLEEQVPKSTRAEFRWDLRIINDTQFNAYASPDGTLYVESGLAQIAGQNAGFWAAILSHEMAHVLRRDWALRYLYERSLENRGNATIVLGDPASPDSSWTSSEKASESLAHFCRHLEIEADRGGLILMARAGYHPHFMPALHHLLHARHSSPATTSLYAMHPC